MIQAMTLKDKAVYLLDRIWRGVPASYKSRYRMTIWNQFENEIHSAAYTNSLGKFVSSLCSKLNAEITGNPDERADIETILNVGQDRELLKLFREETTLLVLMVRVANQERREEWEALHNEREGTDENLLV